MKTFCAILTITLAVGWLNQSGRMSNKPMNKGEDSPWNEKYAKTKKEIASQYSFDKGIEKKIRSSLRQALKMV